MTMTDTSVAPEGTVRYLQWGPIIAGALAAAAFASVLHSFALALGLAVSSSAPTWRDTSFALVLLSGLYLILVALASYSLGGYIAGRVRPPVLAGTLEETEFRDGAHGLVVWALATLLTVVLALGIAQAVTRVAAPSAPSSGPATSSGAENIIAYDLDRLFRGERAQTGDMTYTRSEAGRILLTASSHRGMLPEDRNYLIRLVSLRTGLAEPEATRRVDDVVARAKDNITRARRSAIILGFMIGAAALIGAVAAWVAACAGGRHRDGEAIEPAWMWRGWIISSRTP
jgi:hypothetical protein